jgi:DNA-binding MarR family transcriptional regulator
MAYEGQGLEGGDDGHDDVEVFDDDDPYVIELSPRQVDRVIRDALEEGNLSVMLAGIRDARDVIATERSQLQDGRLSQSLLAGLLTLAAFPSDGDCVSNSEISRSLGLSSSTVHRYISTLEAIGLVRREPGSRRYRLI